MTVLSEGQGYGMFIAAHDPAVKESNFAKLVQYYLKHRDRNTQLMAWRQTKKNGAVNAIALLMGTYLLLKLCF